MSAAYYVRIAGKVYGTFDAERLKRLAAGGKLVRDHEISRDRVRWVPAGNVKGLFPSAKSTVERLPKTAPLQTIVAAASAVSERLPAHEMIAVRAASLPRETVVYGLASGRPTRPSVRWANAVAPARENVCALVAALVASLALGSCWTAGIEPLAVPLALLAIVLVGFALWLALFRGGAGRLMSVGGGIVALSAIGISTGTGGHRDPENLAQIAVPPPSWADVDKPLRIDDVRVRIASVDVGRVPLEGLLDEGQSTDPHLMVRLTIENLSQTRKIDFRGFDPEIPVLGFAQMTDNHHNLYRSVGFGASKPKGQLRLASIYPGNTVDDILVFEAPVKTASYLRLELPAKTLGRQGAFRFHIQRASIRQ